MKGCPFYNGQNLVFTGSAFSNPYGLIQQAGFRRKKRRTIKRRTKRRRNTHTKKRYNR